MTHRHGSRCARALGAGLLLALAFGANPALAETDETLGPVTIPFTEETPEPLAMPTTIPPVGAGADLVEYEPEGAGTRRHWLDRPSIVIEEPYVRATVVVESSSGARTVSHYGFDCGQKSLALLAMGGRDGSWREVASVDWRSLSNDRRHTPYLIAVYRAVCQGGGPTRTVEQMVERLENPRMSDPF